MEKMKALRKKLAAKGGFTLVELIVVIAILAILAAVAVPTYTGYIKKANEAADLTQLDAIKTAVVVTATEDNANVAKITVTGSAVTYASSTAESATSVALTTDSDFLKYVGMSTYSFSFKSGNTQAVWTAEGWNLT